MSALSPNHHTMQSKANRIHVDIFDTDYYRWSEEVPVHRVMTPPYVPASHVIDLRALATPRSVDTRPFYYSILRA